VSDKKVYEYSIVYLKGDYDEHHLPDPWDMFATGDLEETRREARQVAKENGIPESHYAIVRRETGPWEIVR
jgi:hypothetical protein